MHEHFGSTAKDEARPHLDRAAKRIEDHYAEDLSLEKLAAVAHFSKYHFHRLFHEHFGETVHTCIRRTRLKHAADRLTADLNVSVAQIADACGFSSPQNFARTFKQHYQIFCNDPNAHPAKTWFIDTCLPISTLPPKSSGLIPAK